MKEFLFEIFEIFLLVLIFLINLFLFLKKKEELKIKKSIEKDFEEIKKFSKNL